eukprot:1161625-Pelagomonas_calceolata.AAC.29
MDHGTASALKKHKHQGIFACLLEKQACEWPAHLVSCMRRIRSSNKERVILPGRTHRLGMFRTCATLARSPARGAPIDLGC